MRAPRVLIIDDEASMCRMLVSLLTDRGVPAVSQTDPEQALDMMLADDFDIVVADLQMHKMSGIEVCRRLKDTQPDIPVIIISGVGSQESVVEAIRSGADNFLTKPFDIEELKRAIESANDDRERAGEIRRLSPAPHLPPEEDHKLIGDSRAMTALRSLIARAAPSGASVMIVGERGTEKELIARSLHAGSRKNKGPFFAVNCAAFPEAVLESLAAAEGGTVFLDDIDAAPMSLQVRLLRAIEDRQFNARIISAASREIDNDVTQNRFRQDLYYLLNVVEIPVPSLRERGDDVFILAAHYLARSANSKARNVTGFSREATKKIIAYSFPENLRELASIIERGVAVSVTNEITLYDLPESVRNYQPQPRELTFRGKEELITVAELEERYVMHVLRILEGNKREAADVLQIDRKTLYRKLDRWANKE